MKNSKQSEVWPCIRVQLVGIYCVQALFSKFNLIILNVNVGHYSAFLNPIYNQKVLRQQAKLAFQKHFILLLKEVV